MSPTQRFSELTWFNLLSYILRILCSVYFVLIAIIICFGLPDSGLNLGMVRDNFLKDETNVTSLPHFYRFLL